MRPVLLAFCAYGFGVAHDVASLRGVGRIKPWLFGMMALGHALSTLRLTAKSERFPFPRPLQRAAALLSAASFGAMMYSLTFEIPLRKAWLRRGHTDELVTDGTYSLTRHPGVLWYTIAVLSLAAATRSRRLLRAAPALIAGDVAHVAFQERVVLPAVFGEQYRAYQRQTPMLVPTAGSLRHFLRHFLRPVPGRSR